VNARRWVGYLLPDAFSLQMDWLRELVRGDDGLLAQVARSPTARRLLTRTAYQRHQIPVPSRASLAPDQQWLLSDPRQQVLLARRLGLEALRDVIRTTIDAPSVAILRKTLGDDVYRATLAGPSLAVEGLERASFVQSLKSGKLADHVTAVGVALLETTTQPSDAFARMRMRFAFSPACWNARPRNLHVEGELLALRIAESLKPRESVKP
jgi:hypothetical protein